MAAGSCLAITHATAGKNQASSRSRTDGHQPQTRLPPTGRPSSAVSPDGAQPDLLRCIELTDLDVS